MVNNKSKAFALKMKEVSRKVFTPNVVATLISIAIGILLGFVILFISNPRHSFQGLGAILIGGFANKMKGIGQTLYLATPLILTGLAVGFSFKAGQFNIGASGQFLVGGFVAIYIGVKWTFLPGALHWIVAILGAAVAGALWGALPGLLKAFYRVSEVISTILFNFVAMYVVNMLIMMTVYHSALNETKDVAKSAELPTWFLRDLFSNKIGSYVDKSTISIGIFIAIFIAIIVYFIISKTRFGFEIKACGYNPDAAKASGMNVRKNIVLAMAISGALAGIGGALLFLSGPTGRHIKVVETIPAEGFTGLSVALLGSSHPIGIIFTALFISHITMSGQKLQSLNYISEIINIIIGVIIFFSGFSMIIQQNIGKIKTFFKFKKKGNTEELPVEEATEESVVESTEKGELK
ncbi:MAG: beta-methylgalactoside transporter inner membrane component [Tenericutes bacterium ADurb.Bin239]|jgi:ABC-type uncharacterized transport system permease subunit|nr:MAG: beta-methylgalactoside transporter inner membrane component [Tenericutes bacterium ADurb.Bin239]